MTDAKGLNHFSNREVKDDDQRQEERLAETFGAFVPELLPGKNGVFSEPDQNAFNQTSNQTFDFTQNMT